MRPQLIEKLMFLGSRIISRFPPLGMPLRYMRFHLWRWRRKSESDIDFDINKTVWVNPEKIEFCTLKKFDIWKDRGRIIDGDWDRLEKRFADKDVYKAFKEHFINGKDWNHTSFYNTTLNEILRRGFFSYSKALSECDINMKNIDILYNEIKLHGYKTNKEILLEKGIYNPIMVEDEVTVNIGRYGDLLYNDGKHRLTIAKLQKISLMPIKIVVRHPQWMELRKQLIEFATGHGGLLYHPLTHPDLRDIKSRYDDYRFKIIKQNLSIKDGELLDIGARLGYFCCKFEDEGFECYAVEPSLRCLYFLKKLKRAENKRFKIIAKSIFKYKKREKIIFDVVLALNVFHHFLKKKGTYEELISLLKRLEAKELYLQTHKPEEKQMEGAYVNLSPDDFVEFIIKNSSLEEYKFIGKTTDGRPLYKLYRTGFE